MIDSGPSTAEIGVTIMPTETKLLVNPAKLLPKVDNQEELRRLSETVGQLGKNELQRSRFYRNRPQIDTLRSFVQELPQGHSLNILNVGPANAEEVIVYAILAHNAGILDGTKVRFVDLATRNMINPNYDLGVNFVGQPIEPPAIDRPGYMQEDGRWYACPEVQQFVNGSLDRQDNSFGTAIEQFCREDDGRKYYVVTCNNVTQYLGRGVSNYDNPIYQENGDFSHFQAVLLSVAERVKSGGLLFIEGPRRGVSIKKGYKNPLAVEQYLMRDTNFDKVFEVVNSKAGIYRRKNNEPLKMKEAGSEKLSNNDE